MCLSLQKPGEPKPDARYFHPPHQKPADANLSLNHLHRRRIVSIPVRFHNNLDILIERHQEAEQAFDGELAELAAQHLRYIGLADSEQSSGFHLFEAALLQDRINLEYKLRFCQVLFGIGHAEVLKYVAASGSVSLFVAHCFVSPEICSASRNLCLIRSTSRRGVCRPLFDFFWKA